MIFTYQDNKLQYAMGGDNSGFPVFINYGLIGSTDISTELHNLALKKNLKLIILERPGYGQSDFIKMNNFADWNLIVEQFFTYVNVSNFAVIGVSAGAPFTHAMVHHFSERLVGGAYILSGVPYIYDQEIINQYNKKNLNFYRKIWHFSQEELQQEMKSILGKYTRFPLSFILPKSIKKDMAMSLEQDASGLAQTIKLQISNWGIDVFNPPIDLQVWHSKRDEEISFSSVQTMVNKMQRTKLNVQNEKGHMPSQQTLEQVFTAIQNKPSCSQTGI